MSDSKCLSANLEGNYIWSTAAILKNVRQHKTEGNKWCDVPLWLVSLRLKCWGYVLARNFDHLPLHVRRHGKTGLSCPFFPPPSLPVFLSFMPSFQDLQLGAFQGGELDHFGLKSWEETSGASYLSVWSDGMGDIESKHVDQCHAFYWVS